MSIYLSMQRVRFSSPDGYEKFKVIFADTRNHLMKMPGFLHLTWWVHPEDPGWFNEVSFWINRESLKDWHVNVYHKYAKEWAARGAIMEDIITNFEHKNARLLRVCPCCGLVEDKPYELQEEQKTLQEPCPQCSFNFPVMPVTDSSFAVFKDIPKLLATSPSTEEVAVPS